MSVLVVVECAEGEVKKSSLEVASYGAQVAALLSPTPVSRDELVRATRAPTSAVMAALVELALAERAELLPGGMVAGI